MKKLLVSVIGRLIANAGMQALLIVVVKIVGNADLGVGQVGKTGHSRSSSTSVLSRDHRLSACALS